MYKLRFISVSVASAKTKRKVYALALIGLSVTVLLTVFAFTFNFKANPINLNEDNRISVKIANFSMVDKQWSYLGGLTFDSRFNMTIQNKGVSNVTGLELKVKLFSNGSEIDVGNYFSCADENDTVTEPLYAGGVRSCDGTILCNVGDRAYGTNLTSNETTIIAQVILNGNILDEKKSQ